MYKWRLAATSICECGTSDQTTAHVTLKYMLHRAPPPLPRGCREMICYVMKLNVDLITSPPASEENSLPQEDFKCPTDYFIQCS